MHEAFAAYENIRHRLPATSSKGACVRPPNLDAIAEEFDTFFLDAFGVLNIGETAISGVPERVAGLQKAGKRVLIVSNAAGFPHAMLMEKYKRLGNDFDPEDVITSRKALLHGIASEPARRWGLMATESLGRADIGHLNCIYLAESSADYDSVDAFMLIGGAAWTEERQALLEASILSNPRPVYVGNPDIVAPREGGFLLNRGHLRTGWLTAQGCHLSFLASHFLIFSISLSRDWITLILRASSWLVTAFIPTF